MEIIMEDNKRRSQASQNSQSQRSQGMSPQEAGHLGGTAEHRCRGFQCQQNGNGGRSNHSNKGSKNRDEENNE